MTLEEKCDIVFFVLVSLSIATQGKKQEVDELQ